MLDESFEGQYRVSGIKYQLLLVPAEPRARKDAPTEDFETVGGSFRARSRS